MKGSLLLSQRAQAYPPSGIRKMAALAAQYQDTINLTLGEPDFDTPVYIREAAKRALEGMTLAFMALLDPGDEVLVPDPCFSNYYGQAILVGAKAVPVPT